MSATDDSGGDQGWVARLTRLLAFRGLERLPIESAEAGDIVPHRVDSRPPPQFWVLAAEMHSAR